MAQKAYNRRSSLQIVIDAEEPLSQAQLAGKYITALREDIQEIVNACSDETIGILTARRMLTKSNIEAREAHIKAQVEARKKNEGLDGIFT